MRRTVRSLVALPAAALGVGLAMLVGVAVAKTFNLGVANSAKVTDKSSMEAIAVTSKGLAVYTLSGDSKSHPECTAANHCFTFWPPVTVGSVKHLTKAGGIKGKLGVWRRDGFNQLTLNGHPLYRYSGDGGRRDFASGDGINTFGGIWHVVAVGTPASSSSPMPSTPTTTTTTAPTTTTTPTTPTTPYPPTPPY